MKGNRSVAATDLYDHLSSPIRAEVECCRSHDCLDTKIPSSSNIGCHPWLTGGLRGWS